MEKWIKESVLFLRKNLFGAVAFGLAIEAFLIMNYTTPTLFGKIITIPGFFVSGAVMSFLKILNIGSIETNNLRIFSFFGAFFDIVIYAILGAFVQNKFFKKLDIEKEFDFFYVPGFLLSKTPLKR